MPKYTGVYPRSTDYFAGDTIPSFTILVRNKLTKAPIIPVSVCCQLRSKFGALVHTFEVAIGIDGTVTIGGILNTISATFKDPLYTYDVRYTMLDGKVITYVEGTLRIKQGSSKC